MSATESIDANGLLQRSREALTAGEHRRGLELAEQARALAAPQSAEAAQARCLEGQHLWRQGRFEDAAVAARDALAQAKLLDDAATQCDALSLLAVSYSELGLHDQALQSASAAFDIAHDRQLEQPLTQALNRIGVCHERLGDPEQAERFLLQALARSRDQRNFHDTLVALNNLMATTIAAWHLLRRRGENEAAHQALRRARGYGLQAVAMARRDGGHYARVVTQGNLGEALVLAGEFDDAEKALTDTIEQAHQHGFRAVELRTRHNLGELRSAQGRHEEAVQVLAEVLDALRSGDHETTRMRVHAALYRATKSLGRFESALAHCEAYYQMELARAALQMQAQARLMVNRIDMEQALHAAESARLRSLELEARNEALQRDAFDDPLTGLANRRRVDRELPALLERSRHEGRPLALAMIDVDFFKGVNDRFGHPVGDEVLRVVAARLRERLRTSDLAARLGGEEFLVVLVDAPPELAADIGERLRAAVEQHPWQTPADGLAVTLSIGLADAGGDTDVQAALQRADAALYDAKHQGRNRLSIAPPAPHERS